MFPWIAHVCIYRVYIDYYMKLLKFEVLERERFYGSKNCGLIVLRAQRTAK